MAGLEDVPFEQLPLPDPDAKPIENRKIGLDNSRMINFGEDFHSWDDAHKIRYLKKLASAMNHAADIMQQERNKLLKELELANRRVESADKQVAIQKKIVFDHLTSSNEERQKSAKQIQELQARVRTQDKVIQELNDKLADGE